MKTRKRARQAGAVLFALGLVVTMMTTGLAPSPVGEASGIIDANFCLAIGPFGSCTDETPGTAVLNITGTANDASLEVFAESLEGDLVVIKEANKVSENKVSLTVYVNNPEITVAWEDSDGNGDFVTLTEIGESALADGLTITLENAYKKSSTKTIDDEQTALDFYSASSAADQSWTEFHTVMSNYLQDTRTVAFAKAQAAAIEAMDAGKTESEVKTAARNAVEDYYAQREMNYIRAWETKVATVVGLSERAVNETGVSNSSIVLLRYDPTDGSTTNAVPGRYGGLVTKTFTLVNGTDINVQVYEISSDAGWWNISEWEGNINSDFTWTVVKQNPVEDKTSFRFLNTSVTGPFRAEFPNASSMVVDNAQKWVNATYDDFQNDTLNTSEFINPTTLAQEYANKYNESGYYAYAAASLASMGFEVPNLNETASMTISYNGTNYTGLLMSQNAPSNGTWETGTQYDTSLISGVQLFASQEDGILTLDGTFTVESIQGQDGDTIQNTSSKEYVYQTINNSEYLALQEDITDLRTTLEGMEPSGTGGTGTGSGLGMGAGVAFLIGGALVWYMAREEQ